MIKNFWNKLKEKVKNLFSKKGTLVFEIYKDKKGKWRWVLKSIKNHKKVASSGESFESLQNTINSILLIKKNVLKARAIIK